MQSYAEEILEIIENRKKVPMKDVKPMKELKPCPFCGAEAHLWKWNDGCRVDCSRWRSKDDDVHFVGIGARTEKEAIERWNTRFNTADIADKR